MTPKSPETILAFETAVQGGSISLLRGGTEIDHRVGDSEVSRAEQLLSNIEEILRVNEIDATDLDLIAVSVGPGSFTGIRIGLATALGLKNALNIDVAGISVLEAMAIAAENGVIAAVPIGRRDVCWRLDTGDLKTGSDSEFLEFVNGDPDYNFVVHGGLLSRLRANRQSATDLDPKLSDAGTNLAYVIGLAALRLPGPHPLRPIFASVHQ